MVSVSPGDEFRDFGTAPVALVTGDTAQSSELFHYFYRSCYYAHKISSTVSIVYTYRRACGHVDVGTRPHQVLKATGVPDIGKGESFFMISY